MKKIPLHVMIFAGMFAGLAAGLILNTVSGGQEAAVQTPIYAAFDGVATLFLNLLKLIVVPLVFFSLLQGMLGLGDLSRLGRLGGRTIGLYLITSFLAIVTGLILVNVIQPGAGVTNVVTAAVDKPLPEGFWEMITSKVPSNIIRAAADMDMFGIILFTVLFGAAMLGVSKAQRRPMADFAESGGAIMMRFTEMVLWLAPIGIGAMIARLVARQGIQPLIDMWAYVLTVATALLFHMLVTLPALNWFITRRNPYQFLWQMLPAYMTGFSTASSSGTLAVTMECAEERAGVSRGITSFVLPLGATVNMDGTALYEIVTVLCIAQIHAGVDPSFSLSLGQQLMIVVLGLAVSIGAAGIPHAGLVMMVIILQAVGLPPEYTAIIWAIDRPLDMLRTAVNISSDSTVSYIVAHQEDAIDELKAV